MRRKAQQKKQSTSGISTPNVPASSGDTKPVISLPQPGRGEGSTRAIVQRSPSLDQKVPRMFNDFLEQEAICAFFLDFVLLPRHPDSVLGHLGHLMPLYEKVAPESPLVLATSSVALVMSGASSARQSDQQLGRSIFGRALRKTSAAIKHPVESKKDETLMAVLLLGLYEVCCRV